MIEKFETTKEMKQRVKENKEGLESKNIEDMRTYWIAFCDKFFRETKGQFDIWWNPDNDMFLMYVASVWIWYSVIIDWDIWRNTVEEFLWYIEDMENKIIELEKELKK